MVLFKFAVFAKVISFVLLAVLALNPILLAIAACAVLALICFIAWRFYTAFLSNRYASKSYKRSSYRKIIAANKGWLDIKCAANYALKSCDFDIKTMALDLYVNALRAGKRCFQEAGSAAMPYIRTENHCLLISVLRVFTELVVHGRNFAEADELAIYALRYGVANSNINIMQHALALFAWLIHRGYSLESAVAELESIVGSVAFDFRVLRARLEVLRELVAQGCESSFDMALREAAIAMTFKAESIENSALSIFRALSEQREFVSESVSSVVSERAMVSAGYQDIFVNSFFAHSSAVAGGDLLATVGGE
ncbi:MAG: hypothetical protein JXR42_01220 [Gammaproteobacteria bacterium]|nr:hypothetical protein [Gammaproteobacteria bacterium]